MPSLLRIASAKNRPAEHQILWRDGSDGGRDDDVARPENYGFAPHVSSRGRKSWPKGPMWGTGRSRVLGRSGPAKPNWLEKFCGWADTEEPVEISGQLGGELRGDRKNAEGAS